MVIMSPLGTTHAAPLGLDTFTGSTTFLCASTALYIRSVSYRHAIVNGQDSRALNPCPVPSSTPLTSFSTRSWMPGLAKMWASIQYVMGKVFPCAAQKMLNISRAFVSVLKSAPLLGRPSVRADSTGQVGNLSLPSSRAFLKIATTFSCAAKCSGNIFLGYPAVILAKSLSKSNHNCNASGWSLNVSPNMASLTGKKVPMVISHKSQVPEVGNFAKYCSIPRPTTSLRLSARFGAIASRTWAKEASLCLAMSNGIPNQAWPNLFFSDITPG
mmetsp:Transcript_43494/g.94749  ORF Transcript_43494/g.94749 Transcript_43494/m.94749 type:complete len:271 (-) Transcript_43494:239-1051(-)